VVFFFFPLNLLLHPQEFIACIVILLSQSLFLVKTNFVMKRKKDIDSFKLLWCLRGIVVMGLSYLCPDFSSSLLLL